MVVVIGSASDRSVSKDGLEFLRQEGELVLKVDWSFEDDDEGV